jgi:HEAT repeat protein
MKTFLSTFATLLLVLPAFADTTAELIAKLKSPNSAERRRAAEQLGEMKAVEAIPALSELVVPHLKDNSVSEAARAALRKMGPEATRSLLGKLKAADESEKLKLLRALQEMQPDAKDSLPALTEALKDKSPEVRIHAAAVLGNLCGEKELAIPILHEAGKDTSNVGPVELPGLASSVCVEAIRSAKKIDLDSLEYLADEILPDLTKALKSKNDDTFKAACAGLFELSYFAEPAKKELLEAKVRAKGPLVYYQVERLLLIFESEELDRKKDESSIEKRIERLRFLAISDPSPALIAHKLRTAFEHDDVRIRYAALQSLEHLKEAAEPAIPAILAILSDQELATYAIEQQRSGFEPLYTYISRIGYAIVPSLIKVVQDKSNKRGPRYNAASVLVQLRYGLKKYRDEFELLMSDYDSFIATKVVALYVTSGGQLEKATPVLEKYLKDDYRLTVFAAIEAIEKIGGVAAPIIPLIEPLLKHPDKGIRYATLRVLSRMGSAATSSLPKMLELLKSGDTQDQKIVLQAILEFGKEAKSALPVILQRFPDFDPSLHQVTYQIVEAVGTEAKEAVPLLIKMLNLDRPSSFKGIADALGAIGPEAKAAIPKLTEALEHTNIDVRTAAARALGGIGSNAKEAIASLQRMKKSKAEADRIWSGYALAKITGEYTDYISEITQLWNTFSGPPKKDFLRPASVFTNSEIARALALLGSHAHPARDFLLGNYLSDRPEFGTRKHLAQALANLTDDSDFVVLKLVPKLQVLEKNPPYTNDLRSDALHVFRLMGPRAKSAIPAIQPLLESNSGEISEAAFKTLQRIEGK